MGLPTGTFSRNYLQDMAIIRTRSQWLLLIVGLILLFFVFPRYMGPYHIHILNTMGIFIIATLGLNLVTGYAGQLSLGHSAFVAVGAYASGILASRYGVPFWVALPLAGIAAGLVGVAFGAAALRVKGLYLIVATLAAQFIIIYIIEQWVTVTGGTEGFKVEPARLGGFVFNTDLRFYFIIMVCLVIATLAAKNLVRTKPGRAMVAVRDNDLAAEVMGVGVSAYKILAFFIGCLLAGVAGSLWAHWRHHIGPGDFTLMGSIWYLGYLIIGGMGSISGPFFGVIFVTLITETLSSVLTALGTTTASFMVLYLQDFAFGLIIILFLIFEPRGLAHRWGILKSYYRLWPFSY